MCARPVTIITSSHHYNESVRICVCQYLTEYVHVLRVNMLIVPYAGECFTVITNNFSEW